MSRWKPAGILKGTMWKGWEICKVVMGEQAESVVRSDGNISHYRHFGGIQDTS